MLEQLIPMLEEQGVSFEEDYDAGTININVATMDKSILISVIGMLNDMGATFTIDETSLMVTDDMIEPVEPDMTDEDMQMSALDDAMETMY